MALVSKRHIKYGPKRRSWSHLALGLLVGLLCQTIRAEPIPEMKMSQNFGPGISLDVPDGFLPKASLKAKRYALIYKDLFPLIKGQKRGPDRQEQEQPQEQGLKLRAEHLRQKRFTMNYEDLLGLKGPKRSAALDLTRAESGEARKRFTMNYEDLIQPSYKIGLQHPLQNTKRLSNLNVEAMDQAEPDDNLALPVPSPLIQNGQSPKTLQDRRWALADPEKTSWSPQPRNRRDDDDVEVRRLVDFLRHLVVMEGLLDQGRGKVWPDQVRMNFRNPFQAGSPYRNPSQSLLGTP